jgi:hypothetical protein
MQRTELCTFARQVQTQNILMDDDLEVSAWWAFLSHYFASVVAHIDRCATHAHCVQPRAPVN